MNKNVWLLASCQSLMMTNNVLLVTSAALVGMAIAENPAFATLPLALQFLATMLASIPASLSMGRFGRRPVLLAASMLGLCGGLLASFAIITSQFWLFCLGTMMIGTFNGFGNYYRFAAVDVVSATLKSRAISYVMAGGVIAAIMGPNIVNLTHNSIDSAQFAGSYLIASMLYIVTFVILLFTTIPHHNQRSAGQTSPRFIELLRRPVYLVAIISGMFGYAVMSLVMTATPLSMSHHHSLSDTAFVIQWHVLGMFAPSFVTGRLIARYGVVNIMLVGAIMLIVAVLVNLLGNSLWHFWFALVSLGIGWNFLFIGATDLLTYSYLEHEKSKAQAMNDFSVFTAVTIAALTAGYLQNQFGWQVVNLGVIPMIISVFIALFWLRASLVDGKKIPAFVEFKREK